jgi:hypothetical protein
MPEDLHGWYCPECCPACKVQPFVAKEHLMESREQTVDQAA